MARSLEVMNASLSPDERERLSNALGVILVHALGGTLREAVERSGARKKAMQALDGKSAAELIAEADRISSAGASRPAD